MALLVLLSSTPALAEVRHSGTVVALDHTAGILVLEEIGPGRGADDRTLATRFDIHLVSFTRFSLARRSDDTSFPGDFVEAPIGRLSLREGDRVTVDCLHEGRRLIALRVIVTPPDRP